jgi:hypothetical protein
MRASTAMAGAFERAGFSRHQMRAHSAVSEFIAAGGTRDEWIAVFDAYQRLPRERQPNGDGAGHPLIASGHNRHARPSPTNRDGVGHTLTSPAVGHQADARPVREPTVIERRASSSVARVVALTVLDTFRIDGRPVGDWTVGEARRVGREKTRYGAILIEASRLVANAKDTAKLRDVVKVAEMQKIIQHAAEVADAF